LQDPFAKLLQRIRDFEVDLIVGVEVVESAAETAAATAAATIDSGVEVGCDGSDGDVVKA